MVYKGGEYVSYIQLQDEGRVVEKDLVRLLLALSIIIVYIPMTLHGTKPHRECLPISETSSY